MSSSSSRVTSCEMLVTQSLSSPLVRQLISGLTRAGCQFSLARHVACEPCADGLAGGYDREMNQVVICSNKCQDLAKVTTILSHELVHMYDNCTAKIDWENIEHLACSEVRAASLAHCSGPLSAAVRDGGAWTGISGQHGACVQGRAARSVKAILKVEEETAIKAVKEVFGRCYRDTEPVGRFRCRV